MASYPDWGGRWSIRFAVATHKFLQMPNKSSDLILEPHISRNRVVGYNVIKDPKVSSAWDNTFLLVRGADEVSVRLNIPTVTPPDLKKANDLFIEQLPSAGAFRNRLIRLEGDVVRKERAKNVLESVEIFCIESAVIQQYALLFICLDEDLDQSPGGSAIAIRR